MCFRLSKIKLALLVAAILLSLTYVNAFASTTVASGTCGDNLTWALDDTGTLTISGTGDMEDYSSYGSTAPWFSYRIDIKKLIVQNGVTSIGDFAFYGRNLSQDKLVYVELPSTVTTMGFYSFYNCKSIETVIAHEGFSGELIFIECINLKNIQIPKTVKWMQFVGCINLESIDIPAGITEIRARCFMDCTNLKNVSIPNTVTEIGSLAFYECTSLEMITLSDNIISIGENAFYNCNSLESIDIPDSVTEIGKYAFYGCSSLESIKLSSNITTIKDNVFTNCNFLKNITIPEGVTEIAMSAFNCCENLTEVRLPSTFNNSTVAMPGGNKSGFGNLFSGCPNLSNIYVDSNNASFSSYNGCLYNKDKTELLICPLGMIHCDIYDDTVSIGQSAFYNCGELEKITLSENITSIGTFAFSRCTKLNEIIILSEISEIPSGCFYGCFELKTIFIPKTVNNIEMAFTSCDNISDIYYQDEKNKWDIISIDDGAVEYIEKATIHYNSCYITYDYATNGGTSTTLNYDIVSDGEEADLSPSSTNTNQRFVGWNTDSNATKPLSSYTPSENVTLYAIFDTPVTGVTLNKSAISLEQDNTETLIAIVAPSNATDNSVTWASSDTSVATVSNGVVTAKSAGTAVITITATDGGYTANCIVTVTEKVIDENAPKITISDIKTMPGKEIQVTVDLSNNTGFASLGIEVGYNSDIMTLTKVLSNTGVGGTFTPAQSYTVNPFNMGWDSASNITYNGNLATLTFTVNEDVPDGIYPITLDYYKGVKGNYVDGDNVNYDENFEPVGFVYISGNVIVANRIPGDINGDESVDNKDATFLLRYLAGWSVPNLLEDTLDIDGSTTVDNKDATILLRYLAGWNVTLH
ncbi:MAG: leucine-rich repeat protein [Clostridia bacterium]|nr:leucine-rich repeat protein [Clostridia bacterium]